MNRKQRRASIKHGPRTVARPSDSDGSPIKKRFDEGFQIESTRRFNDAMRAYKRVLLLKPDHAETCNNLGRVLQTLGKTAEASFFYARALMLMPQLLQQYAGIRATLISLLPDLDRALRRQATAWPRKL